ncbi:hypothetical protein AcV5_006725 [Taiwanofungus camphoratus]|nr:hypothetical protein AcV5_006725 [Antrodia cinnamomea]KAI0935349.1 hypothetical protein AcV7_003814 [Antrodia cinnamomea]
MDPSRPSGHDQRSLPDTTGRSGYQHSSSGPAHFQQARQSLDYPVHAYSTQQPSYYHPSSQYGVQPSGTQFHPHPQYPSSVHPTGPQNPYPPMLGQTLRDLPFSHAHSTPHGGQGGQSHGVHAGTQLTSRSSYSGQNYSQMSSSTHRSAPQSQYQSAGQGIHYIPTPAQTMQSYHNLSSRSPESNTNIVIAPASSPSPGSERYACEKCDRTFSRLHDRKRHYESQHMQTTHLCPHCGKDFSRSDSLKRHLDNGCDKMPPSGSSGGSPMA